jgi:hypothetical protein
MDQIFFEHKPWGKAPRQPKIINCQEQQTYRGSNQRLEKNRKGEERNYIPIGGALQN